MIIYVEGPGKKPEKFAFPHSKSRIIIGRKPKATD